MDLLQGIVIGLIILALVQGFMIMRKSSKINHKHDAARVNELMEYINKRAFNLTDENDKNVLMIACSSHYFPNRGEKPFFDVVKHAVASGMPMNQPCKKDGKTALYYALEHKYNTDVVEYLINSGADVNVTDFRQRTPLFEAVKKGGKKYDLIVSKTMNIDHPNIDGVTPLMVAAKEMRINVLHDLLDRGANPKLTHNGGENAYEIASKNKHRHYSTIREARPDSEYDRYAKSPKENEEARRYNFEINEMVRKLKCIVNDKEYKPKKYRRGLF